MSQTPGTYDAASGRAVPFKDAKVVWGAAARTELLRTAQRYHGFITYADLARAIQTTTGVHTRSLLQDWIGDVLELVAQDCHRRGEPQLTALCVREDGTVGPGYGAAVRNTRGDRLADLDQHAAEERLRCYQHFGAELPADGGRPALTPKVHARRQQAKRAQTPTRPVCPTCFTQVPATGVCDTCS